MPYSATKKRITPADYLNLATKETDIAVKIGYLRAARREYLKVRDTASIDRVSKWILDAVGKETEYEKKIGYMRGERGFQINQNNSKEANKMTSIIQEITKQEKIKNAGWNARKYSQEIEKGNPQAVGYLKKAAADYRAGGKPDMAENITKQLPEVREELRRIRKNLEPKK